MKFRARPVLLLAIISSWTVFAQAPVMKPGNYEISMKMSMPGMEMPPMTQTQCVTEAMVKDPQSAIPKGPAGGDCKASDYKMVNNTATFKMTCTQPVPMVMVGEMTYAGDSYSGTMTVDAAGQSMVMAYTAKRLGECPKPVDAK